MSNLHLQPAPTQGTPGAGAYGAPSAAAQFARMAPHEVAFQELQAHPPPLPVKFLPPLSAAEFQQALEMSLSRIHELVDQVRTDYYTQTMGHISERQFMAVFDSHEPLHIDAATAQQQGMEALAAGLIDQPMAEAVQRYQLAEMNAGMPPSTLWLAQLAVVCGDQAADDLQKYTKARGRVVVGQG